MTKPTNPTSRGFSRRQLLRATGGTAALLAAAKLNFPAGAFAQGAGPEVTKAILGFIALSDAGPLLVAKEYADLKVGVDAAPLKAVFEQKKAAGKSAKVAMTFPGGTHDLWIRYWLAAGGIDPDKDVETITVPPPQMVANMK